MWWNKRYIVTGIILFISLSLYGQTDQDPPVSPVLRTVTINQSTGNTEMTWSLSPSTDVAGYVVYLYVNGEGYAIDTLFNSLATSFATPRPGTSYYSESYVVAAFDLSGNISPLSNVLHTIFSESRVDTCNKKIILSWNQYSSYPLKVTGYDILSSVDGAGFINIGHVTDLISGFVIDNFVNGSSYCFVIKAALENSQASFSNKTCLTARMQRAPDWINADFATVTGSNEIALSFTIDPSSEIDLFNLEKKDGITGTFQQLAMIRSDIETITYTDKTGDPRLINYYRLSAINNCNIAMISSNIASNMVLTDNNAGNGISLKWNRYHDWSGSVSSYQLFIDTGNGFNQYAEISNSDTVFNISLPDIIYSITGGKVCFYVKAAEGSNPHGISGESSSNITCNNIEETIKVPNVFTPDGNMKNDLFKPVLTFTPSEYHIVISGLHGKILFETNDFHESWDGSDHGVSIPQGVYLWIIRVKTMEGKSISRTGTVTIFRTR